jgi:hypothetical protein
MTTKKQTQIPFGDDNQKGKGKGKGKGEGKGKGKGKSKRESKADTGIPRFAQNEGERRAACEWAISARLFGFRIAGSCLRPLHFWSGRFAKNTYENSRVSG